MAITSYKRAIARWNDACIYTVALVYEDHASAVWIAVVVAHLEVLMTEETGTIIPCFREGKTAGN